MNNLKDIHNLSGLYPHQELVSLLGFQRTICLQKYKKYTNLTNLYEKILLFQEKVVPLHQQI